MKSRCGSPGYVAPEILAGLKYDDRVDMFSAGVIMFILLVGYPPFRGYNQQEILKKNLKNDIQFSPREKWKNISTEAIDLITLLCRRNPNNRIRSSDAVNHPWIINTSIPNLLFEEKSSPNRGRSAPGCAAVKIMITASSTETSDTSTETSDTNVKTVTKTPETVVNLNTLGKTAIISEATKLRYKIKSETGEDKKISFEALKNKQTITEVQASLMSLVGDERDVSFVSGLAEGLSGSESRVATNGSFEEVSGPFLRSPARWPRISLSLSPQKIPLFRRGLFKVKSPSRNIASGK
eukprot:GHVL01042724.1.p1 GENE.GHVL01042724.1~~GHVL01042724.1.p1  ORF type:complete len:295 (-),score=67.06 GHVL01042724.1:112-996(-)